MFNLFRSTRSILIILAIILVSSSQLNAGRVARVTGNSSTSFEAKGIIPNCGPASLDTSSAILMDFTEKFSLLVDFGVITGIDTAVIDSGIQIHLLTGFTKDKTKAKRITTADSTISLWGSTTLTNRTLGQSKALTLDAGQYYFVVVERTDTKPDTLTFGGDSTALIFQTFKDAIQR